jgi:programmed cell death 8 (apoptosis-inducing factor)
LFLSLELWYGDKGDAKYEDIPQLKFRQWNGRDRPLYYEPESFYIPVGDLAGRENGGISILKGHKVVKINAEEQIAYLDDGRQIKYDKCLIATGMKS